MLYISVTLESRKEPQQVRDMVLLTYPVEQATARETQCRFLSKAPKRCRHRWGSRQAHACHCGHGTDRALFQVTILNGASQDLIPQLKKKYDVDTLDMVFLDHWKDRYLPDTLLLEVS